MTHEIGHNMGAQHDSANDRQIPVPLCYGYVDQANGFRTIMAYPSGNTARVNHFSNPSQLYKGYPTGTTNENNALGAE
ncbi:MAG: hypothetical protein HC902_06070 [Calothrix sp. SM1_5_4]|nr:hypothetical protein [Calothrix sp. SM1_5_4]